MTRPSTGKLLWGQVRHQNRLFWRTPVADCSDGSGGCVPYHEWVTNYIAVIGGR